LSAAVTPRVALVSMPWAPVSEPSLGLALLKQQLSDEDVEARVFHFNLGLLRHLTGHAYQQIASCWGLNEFVFTGVLDDHWSEDQVSCMMERCIANTRFDEDLAFPNATELGEALLELRHTIVPQYLAECAEEVFAYAPTLVGFSCMFDQTLASIALAKVLRQRLPGMMIVCGGYALEGPPGLEVLQAFDVIDAVAVGDGEPQIGKLAKASIGGFALDAIGGVLTRAAPFGLKREKITMDASPDPDFSDWFADLAIAKARDRITISTTVLPVESSRGCWWGQKHHCVFCGIDEDTLSYRSKAPERVLAMLASMRERYGMEYPLRFSDYILPHAYSTTVLPALAEITPRYVLQCEIKANQTEEKIAQFARAGFSELQPGIESFDSNVLRLMDKGVTGMQNVYLLKLGYKYGIQINYNILYGIPGERPEWYRSMVSKIPRLFHLTPPVTRTETIVTRFAPMQAAPSRFGVTLKPRHHRCYDVLFSEAFITTRNFSLDNYAYYFDRYFAYDPEASPFYWTLLRQIDRWKRQHRQREVALTWEPAGDSLQIFDTRASRRKRSSLRGAVRDVYLACDGAPKTLEALQQDVGCGDEQFQSALMRLEELRLIWTEGRLVLGLAVPTEVVEKHRGTQWHRSWAAVYT
jgi:ribosomal peptide maturation radical SAM protein 1